MISKWSLEDILIKGEVSVLILNQPILCPPEILLPVWRRARVRVTVDGGSNRWIEYVEQVAPGQGVPPPHCVTGDFDSIEAGTEAYMRGHGVSFLPTPDQDETDFTKALRIVDQRLCEKGLPESYVVCVCEHSGRLDQIIANLETLHLSKNWNVNWRPVILSQNSLTWLLGAGKHSIEVPTKCVENMLPCGLIPLSGPTTVTTNGLKWDLVSCRRSSSCFIVRDLFLHRCDTARSAGTYLVLILLNGFMVFGLVRKWYPELWETREYFQRLHKDQN